MGPEVVNKNKDNIFHGDYVGRDNITVNIVMFKDSEREFVVTHNANIKPVSYFTGRETELQDLRQRVEEGRKSVLVSGMGGIGKTHICRKLFGEYLKKHSEDKSNPFRYIGYIEYNGDIGSSLQSCLKFKRQEKPEQNQEAAWRELEYLAADGKLLLFVDNVDRPIGEDPGLQRLKGIPGAVVLTSRQTSISDEFEPYPIGFLDVEQCKEIYEKIRFRGSGKKVDVEDTEDLEYIIKNLAGRHTITVELLAHLARTKPWSVKKLREELEEKGFRLAFHKDGELVNIQESYEKLYNLSGLTEAEKNILEAFSVFPYIPLAAETCNKWLLADAGVSEDDDILMGLYQKGWLRFDGEQEGYALHPVFAQFIYEKCKLKLGNHSGLIESCRANLEIPEDGSAVECQRYIPFAENILEKIDMGKDIKQDRFISRVAHLLQYIGEYSKARKLYEKSLEICKDIFGENHPDTAVSYSNLAIVYMAQKKYVKAEELHKKGLRIRENVFGENHPDTATSVNELARVYKSQGNYKKAQELYEKSLQIYERILGRDHPNTAVGYNNLAGIYVDQGEYKKAEELCKKSLQIYEMERGENHPNTAIIYNNLAYLYMEQGKYKLAFGYYLKSYKVLEFKLGLDHPHTQDVYKNMEIAYKECYPASNFQQWLEEQTKE